MYKVLKSFLQAQQLMQQVGLNQRRPIEKWLHKVKTGGGISPRRELQAADVLQRLYEEAEEECLLKKKKNQSIKELPFENEDKIIETAEVYSSAYDKVLPNEVRDMLNSTRDDVFRFLQPKLKCVRGNNDSPVFAFPLLVQDNHQIRKLFAVSYTWKMTCAHCGYQHIDRLEKSMLSFPAVPDDFSLAAPYFTRACFKCQKEDQQMKMEIDRYPEVLVVHFVDGLPRGDLAGYDFQDSNSTYRVMGVVQYQSNPDHFIAWIRNVHTEEWMQVDDISSPVSRFHPTPPGFPGKQVHIVMWEKQPTPAAFQQPPTVQRTPTAATVASHASKPVTKTVTPLPRTIPTAVISDNNGAVSPQSVASPAFGSPIVISSPCDSPCHDVTGIRPVVNQDSGIKNGNVSGLNDKLTGESKYIQNAGQTHERCNCIPACTSAICSKTGKSMNSMGPVTDAVSFIAEGNQVKTHSVVHDNSNVLPRVSMAAGIANVKEVSSAFTPFKLCSTKVAEDGHGPVAVKNGRPPVTKPCTTDNESASPQFGNGVSSFANAENIVAQTCQVNASKMNMVLNQPNMIASNQGGLTGVKPLKAQTILKALVQSDSQDLNFSETNQLPANDKKNSSSVDNTPRSGQSETTDRLAKIAQKLALVKSLSKSRVPPAQSGNTSVVLPTSSVSHTNSLQGTPVGSRSVSPVQAGSHSKVDIFQKFLSDKFSSTQSTFHESKRKRTAAEFQGYVPMKKKIKCDPDVANKEDSLKLGKKSTVNKTTVNLRDERRKGVKFSGKQDNGARSVVAVGKNEPKHKESLKKGKAPLKSALKSPVKSHLMPQAARKVELQLQDDNVDVETILHSLYKKLNLEPGTQAIIVGADGKKKMTLHSPHHGRKRPGSVIPSPSKCVKIITEKQANGNARKAAATIKQGTKRVKRTSEQTPVTTSANSTTTQMKSKDKACAISSSPTQNPSEGLNLNKSFDKCLPDLEKLFSGELSIPEPEDEFLKELFSDTAKVFPTEKTSTTTATTSVANQDHLDVGDVDFDMLELGFSF